MIHKLRKKVKNNHLDHLAFLDQVARFFREEIVWLKCFNLSGFVAFFQIGGKITFHNNIIVIQ